MSNTDPQNPSNMQEQEQQTISALSNELEVFLRSFKDRDGNYKYFDKINNMMATSSTSITIDYIDFELSNQQMDA